MQATARMASVVSSPIPARRRVVRDRSPQETEATNEVPRKQLFQRATDVLGGRQ